MNNFNERAGRFPVLSEVAKDYLSLMPTSVPSEEQFSASGLLISDLRTNLSGDKVRECMCLKSWHKLSETAKYFSIENDFVT